MRTAYRSLLTFKKELYLSENLVSLSKETLYVQIIIYNYMLDPPD